MLCAKIMFRKCLMYLYIIFQLKRLLYSRQRSSEFLEQTLWKEHQKFPFITLMIVVHNTPQNYGIVERVVRQTCLYTCNNKDSSSQQKIQIRILRKG
jgi:hypothetical protein